MFLKGLTSVTFRKLSCEEIISIAAENSLDGIEWGGDIHVVPGNLKRAEEIGRLTGEAGLKVFSYGSYFNLVEDAEDFKKVCETAACLGAPMIRVWAGNKGSTETTEDEKKKLAENFSSVCEIAAKDGIKVSTEFHKKTLTDTAQSCLQLLKMTGAENCGTYWQPVRNAQDEIENLHLVLPYITNVHVFHWNLKGKRYSLKKGKSVWNEYAKLLSEVTGEDHCAIMEFVKNDSVRQFAKDAKIFKEIF